MNKYILVSLFALSLIIICTSCGKENEEIIVSPFIQELTLNNYPKVDGSTSAAPLNTIIASKVLGVDYKWKYGMTNSVEPILDKRNMEIFWQRIKSSQTHESFINLINKETDLILSARKMSSDEKAHADALGVTLIETPIAYDAFVFIINPDNPVGSLSIGQIQDIYTGQITNWAQAGGRSERINAYVRNPNSGSQELMETLVMKGLDIIDLEENTYELIFSMAGALDAVRRDPNGICYTVYYYMNYIASDSFNPYYGHKALAIEGVYPEYQTIANKSYPLVAEVYAVIRSDLDKSSMAYKLYEWIQTEMGKQTIYNSGYIPY